MNLRIKTRNSIEMEEFGSFQNLYSNEQRQNTLTIISALKPKSPRTLQACRILGVEINEILE